MKIFVSDLGLNWLWHLNVYFIQHLKETYVYTENKWKVPYYLPLIRTKMPYS